MYFKRKWHIAISWEAIVVSRKQAWASPGKKVDELDLKIESKELTEDWREEREAIKNDS